MKAERGAGMAENEAKFGGHGGSINIRTVVVPDLSRLDMRKVQEENKHREGQRQALFKLMNEQPELFRQLAEIAGHGGAGYAALRRSLSATLARLNAAVQK